MKHHLDRLKRILLLLLLQGLWAPAFSQTVLQHYVEESLKSNLGLQNQGISLQKSMYALKEAKGLFLPDVQLNTQYLASGGGRKIVIPVGDLLNPVYSFLNNLTNSANFPQIENVSQTFNPNNFYDAKIHTTVPLFDAEIIYNSRIRKEQITLQQAQLNVYKRELIKNVKLAYYGYQQSLQSNKILENAIQLARENLKINRLLVKNGKAIRTVVSRAENELTGLQAQLQDAKLKSLNAAAYFNFLLNKPLNAVIELEEGTSVLVQKDTNSVHRREELSVLESAEKVNALALRLNKSNALPKLSTFIDLGAQGDFLKVNRESPYYLFGVTMTWQIFTGNRNRNKTQQASLDLKSSQNQTSQAEQQLEMEVNTAQNNYTSSLELYRSAVSQTALSQQYFKDEQRLYTEGQALYLELLDAQTRLISDQLKESLSHLTVQTRQTELERAKASYILIP
jgi:outer membrane protein TolC